VLEGGKLVKKIEETFKKVIGNKYQYSTFLRKLLEPERKLSGAGKRREWEVTEFVFKAIKSLGNRG
jgi:hypothetical protein